MHEVARALINERRVLFRNTSQKMNVHEAIIEKDFWVCLTLDYLFQRCIYKNRFAFKGGTSLSKAHTLIQRFSEDIDLILDWRVLGYRMTEPWDVRSKTKQEEFNREANERTILFLRDTLLPQMTKELSEIIGRKAELLINKDDPQTIIFKYPNIFTVEAILQEIKLEIGALATWSPVSVKTITPYAAEIYSRAFKKPNTNVLTVEPERTFWEKATILHHEANRPVDLLMPQRYSRHYYDLYCISKSEFKDRSLKNFELLKKVTEFKMRFYPRGWARYQDAKPGTFKLLPPAHNLRLLEEDYENMREMIFGSRPEFKKMIDALIKLENEINTL